MPCKICIDYLLCPSKKCYKILWKGYQSLGLYHFTFLLRLEAFLSGLWFVVMYFYLFLSVLVYHVFSGKLLLIFKYKYCVNIATRFLYNRTDFFLEHKLSPVQLTWLLPV